MRILILDDADQDRVVAENAIRERDAEIGLTNKQHHLAAAASPKQLTGPSQSLSRSESR